MRKKTFLAVFCLTILSVCPATAQTPTPMSGDTIYGRDSAHYHYEWWSEEYLSDSNAKLEPKHYFGNDYYGITFTFTRGEFLQYQHTDKSLTIVGLAAAHCGQRAPHGFDADGPVGYFFEPDSAEYLYLYNCIRDSFVLLKQVQWHNSNPNRYLHVDMRGTDPFFPYNYVLCETEDLQTSAVLPIYEYYFDTPVTVTDSFYVGYSQWSLRFFQDLYGPFDVGRVFNIGFGQIITDRIPPCPYFPKQLFKIRGEDRYNLSNPVCNDSTWSWHNLDCSLLVFPIISYDTVEGPAAYRCPSVENFRLGQYGNGCAVLMWNTDSEHQSWEVSYGPVGTSPDAGTLVSCPIQVTQLCGLDSGTHYVAYVRAVCSHDGATLYSDWSDSIAIDPVGTESIDPADASLTTLIPNPASEFVQVVSAMPVSRVEAYDLTGRRMLDMRTSGLTVSFSVDGWPSGLYVVVIHTPVGNVAKKLVVR